jgi:hypothetical protein
MLSKRLRRGIHKLTGVNCFFVSCYLVINNYVSVRYYFYTVHALPSDQRRTTVRRWLYDRPPIVVRSSDVGRTVKKIRCEDNILLLQDYF